MCCIVGYCLITEDRPLDYYPSVYGMGEYIQMIIGKYKNRQNILFRFTIPLWTR